MNLKATLQQLGGVKPCPHTHDGPNMGVKADNMYMSAGGIIPCPQCHGTGSIIDLAPLLARPKDLTDVVAEILNSPDLGSATKWDKTGFYGAHVVGPQRASNLVYEIARQLGGTAVVANEVKGMRNVEPVANMGDMLQFMGELYTTGHRLSLHIPEDSTVLFVTDRLDEKEMAEVVKATRLRVLCSNLPYILCLVSDRSEADLRPEGCYMQTVDLWKIISLYQEKP
jgi:hypothetical protein